MINKIKTAIIGIGSKSYYDTLSKFEIIDIAGMWDHDNPGLKSDAEAAGIHYYDSFEEILQDDEIKLVVNALEPKSTYDYSLDLLENGKNV